MNAAAGRTETTPGEAIAAMAICFGWAILLSLHSVAAGFPAPGGFPMREASSPEGRLPAIIGMTLHPFILQPRTLP